MPGRQEALTPLPFSAPGQLPILQGLEIVRQRVLTLGCATPDFELSSLAPKQSGQLKLSNLREQPLIGTLHMVAPKGFEVSPKQVEVKLAVGQRMTIPVEAAVTGDVPAGNYQIGVKLLRSDGTLELERTARIEHLGRRCWSTAAIRRWATPITAWRI